MKICKLDFDSEILFSGQACTVYAQMCMFSFSQIKLEFIKLPQTNCHTGNPGLLGSGAVGHVARFAQFVVQSCGYVTTGFAFSSLSSSTSTKVIKNHKNPDCSDSGFIATINLYQV